MHIRNDIIKLSANLHKLRDFNENLEKMKKLTGKVEEKFAEEKVRRLS